MGLGDKAAAFRLIEREMAVVPVEKDARLGELDRAMAALQKLLSIRSASPLASYVPLTPALPRLDPMFDPLRNDARFQKLCEEKQP
jgi:hypothetical protein